MKNKKHYLVALALLVAGHVNAQRVVIIGLDGISAEGFKNSRHPNLDKMVAEGVLSLNTRPVMPSVTLPNWTSHLTGSGPEEHGVTSNAWTLDKHELQPLETDSDGYYPSIFRVLKDKVPHVKTAYYYNWADLINSMNRKCFDQVSFEANDGYLENYQKAFEFIRENKQSPMLLFLYNVHTDHVGHQFGWMSPQYTAAIEEVDAALGKFLDQLRAANLYNSTYFLFITDHGGKGNGHGGTSMEEMQIPWGIAGPKIRKIGLTSMMYNSNKNTSIVIAHIFKLKHLPESWTGQLPNEIFK